MLPCVGLAAPGSCSRAPAAPLACCSATEALPTPSRHLLAEPPLHHLCAAQQPRRCSPLPATCLLTPRGTPPSPLGPAGGGPAPARGGLRQQVPHAWLQHGKPALSSWPAAAGAAPIPRRARAAAAAPPAQLDGSRRQQRLPTVHWSNCMPGLSRRGNQNRRLIPNAPLNQPVSQPASTVHGWARSAGPAFFLPAWHSIRRSCTRRAGGGGGVPPPALPCSW